MEAATTTAPRPTAPAVRRSVPPGPPLPMPVQTAIWSRQARRLLYACQDRYGDIFMLKVLRETWAVLADPEHVKQVFTGDPSVFHAGDGNELLEPLLGPHSLLTLDEKPHMSQRRLLLPPFHGERMQAYEATMAEIAAREIKSWPSGEPYALRPRMQALTLEIILRTVFGVREGEGLGEMRDALLTLLAAGHETTATSLSWAVERLCRHPEKLARLRAEAEAGEEDTYLTATIQETLRLRPVISIVLRRLTEPVEVGGYELPAGISVAPSIYLVHRNPEVYPDPEAFKPERFLDNPPGTYTWIPFGGGVRRCLGASFAQFEMAVVLRELVKQRGIRPANPKPERVFRRAITETPRHNARVVLS